MQKCTPLTNLDICSAVPTFDCLKIRKDANNIDLSQSSTSNVSLTTGFISSIKVPVDSVTFAEEKLFEKMFFRDLVQTFENLTKFPNCDTFGDILSIFKLKNCRYNKIDFFHQASKTRPKSFLNLKFWIQVIDFVPCVGILSAPKCQRTAVNLNISLIFQNTFL